MKPLEGHKTKKKKKKTKQINSERLCGYHVDLDKTKKTTTRFTVGALFNHFPE